MHRSLELAPIGNGQIGFLLDGDGRVVWGCLPRFDGDPTFCTLLETASTGRERGIFSIDLVDHERSEQAYDSNTAILVTRLYDRTGSGIEITDCAPRFLHHRRIFYPMVLVRRVRPIRGRSRVVVRLRPTCRYGAQRPAIEIGNGHMRYRASELSLRLTTDTSVSAIVEERAFLVDREFNLVLGPDEGASGLLSDLTESFIEETRAFWRNWVRGLAIPFEWQDAVIRAALTLQQSAFDDTGAIVAAMTTSIPDGPTVGRNRDYRCCSLSDSCFVVDALNTLCATETMERYLEYIINSSAIAGADPTNPISRLNGDPTVHEELVPTLAGYHGMGPVYAGNEPSPHLQYDIYGSAILALAHAFFDERLVLRGESSLFARLELLGRKALQVFDKPEPALSLSHGRVGVYTYSSVMCWVACDRLAKIARHLGLSDRERGWRADAERIARFVHERCWNDQRTSFVATADGDTLDANLLLLADLKFLEPRHPRFAATVNAISRELKRGDFVYLADKGTGVPDSAPVICSFWYVTALMTLGREDEARAMFERLLRYRNRHGLFAAYVDPKAGESWGNYPQTRTMCALITTAIRLSIPWGRAF